MAHKHKVEGYSNCPCRDCFEIALDGDLCVDCDAAGCDASGHSECDAPHSYGGDAEAEQA